MRSLLMYLWALWAGVLFIITMFLALPFYMILFKFFGKKAPYLAHIIVSRNWSKVFFFCLGIRLANHGFEQLHKDQTYVFITNHCSQLDIPICALATGHSFRFLSKAELGKIPFLGYIIRKLYILVDRGSSADRSKSMEIMKKSLEDEISVFIYPEGTRNRGERILKPFYDGAFRLAIETGVPIAILTIINSNSIQPLGKFQIRPGIVQCYWETPLTTDGLSAEDVEALKQKAYDRMHTRLVRHRKPSA